MQDKKRSIGNTDIYTQNFWYLVSLKPRLVQMSSRKLYLLVRMHVRKTRLNIGKLLRARQATASEPRV